MPSHLKKAENHLLKRKCVSCGYDGALLRNGQADRCARCGCDLRERPARSYAEMEGLIGQPMTLDAPLARQLREERLVNRWVLFLFLVMLGTVAFVYLTTQALTT